MRLSRDGVPLVVLSHRRRTYLPRVVSSLRARAHGITDVIVVDDSGDANHHDWLDNHGYQFSLTHTGEGHAGYLEAMRVVWCAAAQAADTAGVRHVMLWEEDFIARRSFSVRDMTHVMNVAGPELVHLNLQRQRVYRIEHRFGYMGSHERRGYGLARHNTDGVPWVSRNTPFTTNPGLITRAALDIGWPTREEADAVDGGAEPAMSARLEAAGGYFGWLGAWDTPYVEHVGIDRKSGIGY